MAVLASRDPNDISFEIYTALLDTGATASWISRKIVERFSLVSVGKKPVVVATEIRQRPAYVFRLGLLGDDQMPTAIPIIFAETIGFVIDQASGFDVLLGMDVLSETDFSMYRDGRWTLKFG
ncbi:aspartyl protease family protein [Alteraurantiacibacter palmitatis]|uniref:Aspartyl protease family protein n=1 Tax=Alteraurantiacibacter palmitatis TaxID=2054628 RepID=A0ABV7E1H8_9SPHN